ncbi:MAG: rhodanese-related sulfurtransferase [Flavobacteriaceae bacterium]|nr:rhodanese-related sulfurtransferase [Flavobacteriaceae bacterium]
MQLYNKLSAEERARIIDENSQERITLSFYKYFNLGNPSLFRDHLFIAFSKLDVLGRIYVASEGINAQLSVPKENLETFKKSISEILPLNDIRLNIALEHYSKSFLKLTIKIKEKIVADGLNEKTFDVTKIGEHLDAKRFNQMLDDKNTICIDMRNHYESEIGFFKGAIKPDVDTFRESLETIDMELEKNGKEKNYLMYCTGGIRCEKASAYLKHKGIKNVFQLEGGIIEYTRQVSENDLKNHFIGKNFVFDERRGERISDDIVSNCHQCGKPCDSHINCINESCHLLFIQCDNCKEKMNSCCSNECMEIIELSFEEQKSLRKGKHNSNKIFKKGRSAKLKFKIS